MIEKEIELFLNNSKVDDKLYTKDLNPGQLLSILRKLGLSKTGEFLEDGKANIVFNYFNRSCVSYFQVVIDFWSKTIILINTDD